ncbi:3'(2'),5'-bisphosphate nucleotidase CysQ [Heliophilum fasciatum]|uniref:3'(2'),5'-bisphosphate nucleotidase CysQ n=1 Tax=Heliophilum fasciatum TaxID=35700 RepID=A0A4R2SC47_9FIRM|nr:3'(2'),5'-bisphosphate nucleotidase CysQ [Heliophilum fasciatum]MCW2276794.1 3'(2'), 5'-bisphosphate nucleotidase [Heliophilum fasciatum]TCP68745.1 3'(2'),5'-bisphosphate nucleotidase [Heliophilum fasciatum]
MIVPVDITHVLPIAVEAGVRILEVYQNEDMQVNWKADASPLTLADRRSHEWIAQSLRSRYPDIPLLSEEEEALEYQQRRNWHTLWIVDPLDGTKEFIKRNGEFTVNIGLVHQQVPVAGVVYLPVHDIAYVAQDGWGAYRLRECRQVMNRIQSVDDFCRYGEKLPLAGTHERLTVAVSRSHMAPETAEFLAALERNWGSEVHPVTLGSTIKMCQVAEGVVDLYPRHGPTMEWDTAAGEAIIRYAGGVVIQATDRRPLTYNKENLRNPHFLALRPGFAHHVLP